MQTLIESKITETFSTVQLAIDCSQFGEAKEALDGLINDPSFLKEDEGIQCSVFEKYQEYFKYLIEQTDLSMVIKEIEQVEDWVKQINGGGPRLQKLKEHFLQLKQELFFKYAVKNFEHKNHISALDYYEKYLTIYTEDLERQKLETIPDRDAEKIITIYFRMGEMSLAKDIEFAKQYYQVAVSIYERVKNLISKEMADRLASVSEQIKAIENGAEIQILLTRQQDDNKKQEVINLLRGAITTYLKTNRKGLLTIKKPTNDLTSADIKKILIGLCSANIPSDTKNTQIRIVAGDVKICEDCAKSLVDEFGKDLAINLEPEKPTYKKLSEEGVIDLTSSSNRPMNGHHESNDQEHNKKRKTTENGLKPRMSEELSKALNCDLESKSLSSLKTMESYLINQKEQLVKEKLVDEIMELQDKIVQIDKQLFSSNYS